jgi:putative ABC transport system permease protein
MHPFLGIEEGIKEIWAHKFRSFLTMLGVILGVGSLMAMFALTEGIATGSRSFINQVGGVERVEIRDAPVPPNQEDIAELSPGRTYVDALALRRSAPLLESISAEVEIGGKITRMGNSTNPRFVGVEPDNLVIDKHQVQYGRFITDLDLKQCNRVVVLGHSIVVDLWDDENAVPLGETVLINGQTFTVVGVLTHYITESAKRQRALGISKQKDDRRKARGTFRKNRGNDPFWAKNRAALIPLTTMQALFKTANVVNGVDQGPDPKLSRLVVRIGDINNFNSAIEQMRNILLMTHRGIRDFGFDTREDWFEDIERSIRATRLSGGLIAGISLLVGGLGITNIMLASITERIREIGIRRAIGARRGDIFTQILIEALALALLGGMIGIAVGFGLVQLLILMAPSENSPIISLSSILISIGFALVVGIIAGLYPAFKASQLSPIQALRYE